MQARIGFAAPAAAWHRGQLPARLGLVHDVCPRVQQRVCSASLRQAAEQEGQAFGRCSRPARWHRLIGTWLLSRRSPCRAGAGEAAATEAAAPRAEQGRGGSEAESACGHGRDGSPGSATQPDQFCIVNFYHLTRLEQPFKVSSELGVSPPLDMPCTQPGTLASTRPAQDQHKPRNAHGLCAAPQTLRQHLRWVRDSGAELRGRIYLSTQGINAQYSGQPGAAHAYAEWVRQQPGFEVCTCSL